MRDAIEEATTQIENYHLVQAIALGADQDNMLNLEELIMWKPIFAHDVNGTRTAGDKNKLMRLVHDGQPVRIMFDVEEGRVTSLNCESVFVRNGEVYAQASFIYSEWSDPDRELMKFSTPSSVMTFNLSTSGKSHVRNQHSPELCDDKVYHHAISWFVQD